MSTPKWPSLQQLNKATPIKEKPVETKINHSDTFDLDMWLFSNPHPVSLLLRSASYDDCEACEQDPYIEIPLDQFQEFIDILKGTEYQLNAIQDSGNRYLTASERHDWIMEAVKDIKDRSTCIHPNCTCLDYCMAEDPHSKPVPTNP